MLYRDVKVHDHNDVAAVRSARKFDCVVCKGQ